MESVQGVVENVVFQSADGQFCVIRVKTATAGLLTVTYRGPAPFVGENLRLQGEYMEHARFGRQLRADVLESVTPSSAEGMERFLGSGAIKGIGRTMAARIIEHFGSNSLDVLANEPFRLAEVAGIGKKKAEAIGIAYAELSDMRELMLFLEQHGISANYAPKLQANYGNSALMKLKDNPYSLAEEVAGIGFRTADKLALALGFGVDSKQRITAGIAYALSQAASAGHTCLPEELLQQESTRFLQIDSAPVREALQGLIRDDRLRIEEIGGQRFMYPEYLYQSERGTAEWLVKIRDHTAPLKRVQVDKVIAEWESKEGMTLADNQREAIHASLKYGVFVLTGGPGTGKTTIVKGILAVLEKAGCRILLAAPTGRAARRLSESAGHPALTVHRLLEYQPAGNGFYFGKDEDSPLDAEAIIVDEASMLDITLMYHLLKAIPPGCRLILVGDVDQLPSVGAGSVLKDIIRSRQMPVVRLEYVFRQAQISPIVQNAHRINRGQLPDLDINEDFTFVEFAGEVDAADYVTATYARLTAGDWQAVQVLSPMHKNPCGVQNLNRMLQQRVNPPTPLKSDLQLPNGQVLREGDKVMQIRNNYEKEVFNGDIGRIIGIENKNVSVSYPERPNGEYVVYSAAETDELQLAYALSVHKSQGSEYPVVILLLVLGHYIMLQRNLLYTAVTRAKQRVILVGSKTALQTAVANDKTRKRYSLLAERLQEDKELF